MYLSIVLLTDHAFPECEGGDGERGLARLAQFVGEHEGDHPGGARHTQHPPPVGHQLIRTQSQSGILHFLDNEKSEDGNDDYDDTPEPRWRY